MNRIILPNVHFTMSAKLVLRTMNPVMCLLTVALIAITSFFISPSHVMAQQPSLVIRNISVIDGLSPEIQPNRTVVIVGNRIKAIGEKGKVAIPKRAKFIDGGGKYLIPGLWDSHVHLNSPDSLPLFVANGITGVKIGR